MFWIKINILYFLCTTLTNGAGTIHEPYVQRLTKIKKSSIWKKLQNRSILIRGFEKIRLSEQILNPKFIVNDSNLFETSEVLYTALKCHCTDSIKYLHETTYKSSNQNKILKTNPTITKTKSTISKSDPKSSFFTILNTNLTLTITILFEISDSVPSLRINEPFLLKALISMQLFIAKSISQKNNTSSVNRPKIRDTGPNKMTPRQKRFPDKENLDRRSRTTDPVTTQRMVLQMMNLIERFTIENCVSNPNSKDLFVNHNDDLKDLIRHTQKPHCIAKNVYTNYVYNIDSVLLNICFDDGMHVHLSLSLEKLCNTYLLNAYIYNKHRNTLVPLKQSFVETKNRHEVPALFEFLESVYKTLKTIVYLKFKDAIEKRDLSGLGLDEEIMKDLLTANCPVELISDLNTLIDLVKKPETDIADKIIDHRLASLSDVRLQDKKQYPHTNMSLQEILECIVNIEFKQYWWVFNLLQYEAEKQSNYVYAVSLEPISSTLTHEEGQKNQFEYKCNAVETVYRKFFRFKSLMNHFRGLKNINSARELFFEIHERNVSLSDHLSVVVEKFTSVRYSYYKDDFLKIVLMIVSNLQNIYYTAYNCENCNDVEANRNFFLSKIDALSRFGHYVINLLDSYQIRYCKSINRDHLVDTAFLSGKTLNLDTFDSALFVKCPTGVTGKVADNDSCYELSHPTSNEQSRSLMNEASAIRIPKKFYDMDFLVSPDLPMNNKVLPIFRFLVYFNCFGSVKNVFEHQLNLENYMLSLHYVVEFQKIVFKWIVASFYIAWIVVYKSFGFVDPSMNENYAQDDVDLVLAKMTYYLREFLSIGFPRFCGIYLSTVQIVYDYYGLEHNDVSPEAFSALEIAMHDELDKLQVFDVTRAFKNINNSITLYNDSEEILDTLTVKVKESITTLKENLIFVN